MESNEESQFKVESQEGHQVKAEAKEMGFTCSSERQKSGRERLALPRACAPKPSPELISGLSTKKG